MKATTTLIIVFLALFLAPSLISAMRVAIARLLCAMRGDDLALIPDALHTSDSGDDELFDQTPRPEPTLSSASTEPFGGVTDILHRDDGHYHFDSDR